MAYTQEEIDNAMSIIEEIKDILVRSHVSANQKIRRILDLYEKYEPEEVLWDRVHRRGI